MKRWLHRSLLALGCASALALPAQGVWAQGTFGQYQQPQWQSRPTISPYLNMTRRGTNAAINYYGLVRPQIDTGRNLQQLQQQFQQLDGGALNQGTTTATPDAGSMLATGHPVAFMNYAAYFPLYARGAGGGMPLRGNTGGLGGVGMGGAGIGTGGVGIGIVGGNFGRR